MEDEEDKKRKDRGTERRMRRRKTRRRRTTLPQGNGTGKERTKMERRGRKKLFLGKRRMWWERRGWERCTRRRMREQVKRGTDDRGIEGKKKCIYNPLQTTTESMV